MGTNHSTKTDKYESYKCTNCGAPITYNLGLNSTYCEYCNSNLVLARKKNNLKNLSKKVFQGKESFNLITAKIIRCSNCFAEYEIDEQIESKNCIFCKAEIYNDDIYDGYFIEPSHIIPFQIEERQFIENLENWLKKNNIFFPYNWAEKNSNITIHNIYIPYWINDINEPTEKRELANTRFDYKKAYICATSYIPSRVVEELEPWDKSQFILKNEISWNNFKSLLVCIIPQKKEDIKEFIKRKISSGIIRYYRDKGIYCNNLSKINNYNLIYLPIYECCYTYNNKVYKIYGNGYTGKIGRDPIVHQKEIKNQKYLKITHIIWITILIIAFTAAIILFLIAFTTGKLDYLYELYKNW